MAKRRSNGTGTLFKRTPNGPWIASWYDHTGVRRERSTKTTDKAAAARILAKRVADAALRREGVIDTRMDGFAQANREPLQKHIDAYIGHCILVGQEPRHVGQKRTHLKRFAEAVGAARLSDLTADALQVHMRRLIDEGLSARTANFARQIAVAFASWAVKTRRLESSPLTVVSKLDERQNRRRVRRPLTSEELASLLAVAEARGRKAWYMAAALAGLRKGDLQQLRWCDIQFEPGTITISNGKAKRDDVIPMHPQLSEELKQRHTAMNGGPKERVFPQTVTDTTRQKDFLRAGIAREEIVVDAAGKPVMIGKGRRSRPKTKIVCEDEEGRVIDLHAMRTTLGTLLARQGVAPQIAQKIMRHGDYRTTLRHYTVLGVADTAKAIAQLPTIGNATVDPAASTEAHVSDTGTSYNPGNRSAVECESDQSGAKRCERPESPAKRGEPPDTGGIEHFTSTIATMCDLPAGVTQLVECQPSKLNVAGSIPVTRFHRDVPRRADLACLWHRGERIGETAQCMGTCG